MKTIYTLLCSLLLTASADAAVIGFSFGGSSFGGSNWLWFDTATPDSNSASNIGQFNGATTIVHMNGFNIGPDGYESDNVITLTKGALLDTIVIRTPLGNYPGDHNYFSLSLEAPAHSLFLTDQLISLPTLGSIMSDTTRQFSYMASVSGSVSSGTLAHLTAVPLPPAVLMFGAGLLALGWMGLKGRLSFT